MDFYRIRALITVIILLSMALNAGAATVDPADIVIPEVGDGRVRGARGWYRTDVGDDKDVMMIVLNDVTVFPPMKFKNKKEEEYYWKTVRDVKKTLPYAKLICETILETYEYIETFPTQKEREDYLKAMEDAIFEQYKPVLKRFTKNQARILIKLIKRETDQSGYSIIKAFLGSFRAGFWQTFGRFFGVNLRSDYRPDTDRKDEIIERIACKVELGQL